VPPTSRATPPIPRKTPPRYACIRPRSSGWERRHALFGAEDQVVMKAGMGGRHLGFRFLPPLPGRIVIAILIRWRRFALATGYPRLAPPAPRKRVPVTF